MTKRRAVLRLIGHCCLLAVVACSILVPAAAVDSSSGQGPSIEATKERIGVSDNEITIGSCLPMSGTLKERGQQLILGANLYFSSINDQGGIQGRKLRLLTCDDVYDPDRAIECFNSCLKDKVFSGAFAAGSAPIAKYVRMAEVTKTPFFGFCSGNPLMREYHGTQFALRASYDDEVRRQVEELWRRGIRRFGVLYQNDAAGAAVREATVKTLQTYHTSPIAEASFPRKSTEVDAAMNMIKAAKPEAVVYVGTSDGLLSTFKKRYNQQWDALFISLSICDDYVEGLKEADGVVLTQVLPQIDTKLPAAAAYEKLLHKQSPTASLNMSAWEAFLNAKVICEGLKRAGTDLTRTKFIRALETVRGYDLGAGQDFRVTFSPTNHNGWSAKSIYFTIVRDGKIVPITEADWSRLIKQAKRQAT